jgi:hypothetical protein
MKRQVMQPFRAPRKINAAQQQTIDSEEDTALGLVYAPRKILETQYSDIEELSHDGQLDNHEMGKHVLIAARTKRSTAANLNQPAISSTVSSPNLSEFEAFMDRASAAAAVRKNKSKKAAGKNKANSKKDVLQRENQRLASEADGALVPVDFMMFNYRLQVCSFCDSPSAELSFVRQTLLKEAGLVISEGCPSTYVRFDKVPEPF